MALRKILTKEEPELSKKCRPVEKFDQKLWDLIDDLKETLERSNGLGLASPQIGILRRVAIVIDAEGKMVELVNPKVIREEGMQDGLEGCLSNPGLWGYVERPMDVTVEAQDRNGTVFQVEGTELVARCYCHEINHLDGVLFTDLCDTVYTAEELEEMETNRR